MKIDLLKLSSDEVIVHSITQVTKVIHDKIEKYCCYNGDRDLSEFDDDIHPLTLYFAQDFDEIYDVLLFEFMINKGFIFDIDLKREKGSYYKTFVTITSIVDGEKDKSITIQLKSCHYHSFAGIGEAQPRSKLYTFFNGSICEWLDHPEKFTNDYWDKWVERWRGCCFPEQLVCIFAFSDKSFYENYVTLVAKDLNEKWKNRPPHPKELGESLKVLDKDSVDFVDVSNEFISESKKLGFYSYIYSSFEPVIESNIQADLMDYELISKLFDKGIFEELQAKFKRDRKTECLNFVNECLKRYKE